MIYTDTTYPLFKMSNAPNRKFVAEAIVDGELHLPRRCIIAMTSNSFQLGGTGFGNDKAPSTGSGEGDFTNDPASSGFFSENFKRYRHLNILTWQLTLFF